MRKAGLSGGQHWYHQLHNVSRKRHASSTVQSRVDHSRATPPLLTSTRLGAALSQMISSMCCRKSSSQRRRLLSTSHRSPGAGREASPCLPDFALCNDAINHPHTCLGLWLSAGEPGFTFAFAMFARWVVVYDKTFSCPRNEGMHETPFVVPTFCQAPRSKKWHGMKACCL